MTQPVTIKKTTHTNCKVVYNLVYQGKKYLLNFYHDGDDYGWFVDCIAVDGVLLDENMQLFYEIGDTNLCNFKKLCDLIDSIFSLAIEGKLHIAEYADI